jgi:hypothetical protein
VIVAVNEDTIHGTYNGQEGRIEVLNWPSTPAPVVRRYLNNSPKAAINRKMTWLGIRKGKKRTNGNVPSKIALQINRCLTLRGPTRDGLCCN